MLGDLHFILCKQRRPVGVEEPGIGKVDVPLERRRRRQRLVVVEAVSDLDESGRSRGIDGRRERHLRPATV